MKTIFFKELKLNLKQFIIWTVTVGLMGFACILLFRSMEGEMKDMADAFSNMGAFSEAFGMATLSVATIEGFFATEVGTLHGIGGGMFAAILAIGIIAKEEERHSGEFLLSLPVSRTKVVVAKGLCVLALLVLFAEVCTGIYLAGFALLGEEVSYKEFFIYMGSGLLMNIEIASICFFISALTGKVNIGAGLGLTLVLYTYDIIGRVVPDLKDYIFVGPYSYANASEIFSGIDAPAKSFVVAVVIIAASICGAFACYNKRDLAS